MAGHVVELLTKRGDEIVHRAHLGKRRSGVLGGIVEEVPVLGTDARAAMLPAEERQLQNTYQNQQGRAGVAVCGVPVPSVARTRT